MKNNNKNDQHFSAGELAGLPGMPGSDKGCRDWLAREAAAFGRPRRGKGRRGGGREYPITCLPAATQAALAEKVLSAAPAADSSSSPIAAGASFSSARSASADRLPAIPRAEAVRESLTAVFDAKPEKIKAAARARLDILDEYHRLLQRGFPRAAVIEAVTRERAISEATLARYLGMVRGESQDLWLFLLCPDHKGRTARCEISAEAWEYLKGEYLTPERRSAKACINRMRRASRGRGWTIPSDRTLLRRLNDIDRSVRVLAREGRKALMNLYPAQQRVRAGLHALAIVNADGYRHNVWVVDEDTGEIYRPHTWVWQDVYSSKILAHRTDDTEHTGQIQLGFGDMCERVGIPGNVLLDNTLAAANKTMSGGISHRFRFKVRPEEPLGVFALFNVDVMWATPAHGQAKPIERAFGIGGLGEYVDKAPECAGAWTGSSTADKPEYGKNVKAVPLKVFLAVLEREIAEFNALEGRRSPIAKGRSFDAVFAESYANVQVRKPTEHQRKLWLLSTEEVAVRNDGTIVLDAGRMVGEQRANRYWNAGLVHLAGRKVVARFDPQRLHEGVHVYDARGAYHSFADCVDPEAFNDQDAAREHSRDRRKFIKAAREQLDAQKRMDERTTTRLLSGAGAAGGAVSAIPAAKVVRAEFRDPLERPRAIAHQPTEQDRADMAKLEQDFAAAARPTPVNVLELQSDADKHAHWKSVDARRGGGEVLADQEEQFWAAWQGSDYYRLERELTEEFDRRQAAG